MRIFGNNFDPIESDLIVLPICWSLNSDVNFIKKIKPIIHSSNQIELFHEFHGVQEGCKIALDPDFIQSEQLDEFVSRAIKETNWKDKMQSNSSIKLINEDYSKLISFVEEKSEYWIEHGKLICFLGGDNSISLGSTKGIAKLKSDFGILHFSEYPCLKPYNGELISEENTFYNIGSQVPEVSKIVGVGYSSISKEEFRVQKENREKIVWFTHKRNLQYRFKGESFSKIVKRWVNNLPEFIYLSINSTILNLYSLDEIEYVIDEIIASRKKIVGLDLSGTDKGLDAQKQKELSKLLYITCKAYGRSRGKK